MPNSTLIFPKEALVVGKYITPTQRIIGITDRLILTREGQEESIYNERLWIIDRVPHIPWDMVLLRNDGRKYTSRPY